MLTALTLDDRSTAPGRAVAHVVRVAPRRTSTHDLLEEFADLVHAAEAAARRAAMAR